MMVRMPNGDLVAQTDEEALVCPKGYIKDPIYPRRFHPTEELKEFAVAEGIKVKLHGSCCRGI